MLDHSIYLNNYNGREMWIWLKQWRFNHLKDLCYIKRFQMKLTIDQSYIKFHQFIKYNQRNISSYWVLLFQTPYSK
jgi:hypothetical protein